jgi:hypothetical protein
MFQKVRWHQEDRVFVQIAADHRLTGDECTTLRGAFIGCGHNTPYHVLFPADPGFDDEIALLRAVSADLAEGYVHTIGANAGSLCQYLAEIVFAQSKTAETRKLRLLSMKPLDMTGGSGIRCT